MTKWHTWLKKQAPKIYIQLCLFLFRFVFSIKTAHGCKKAFMGIRQGTFSEVRSTKIVWNWEGATMELSYYIGRLRLKFQFSFLQYLGVALFLSFLLFLPISFHCLLKANYLGQHTLAIQACALIVQSLLQFTHFPWISMCSWQNKQIKIIMHQTIRGTLKDPLQTWRKCPVDYSFLHLFMFAEKICTKTHIIS